MQVPEKLSTDLKKLLKEQDAEPSFSEEVLETWKVAGCLVTKMVLCVVVISGY